jgi:hypothetical protein
MTEKNLERTPELRQKWHHFAKYKITPEQYQKLLEAQSGKCAICKRGEGGKELCKNGKWRYLAVDHSHQTGQVRGLLCSNCNTLLGLVEGNFELLLVMKSYLMDPTSSRMK